MKTCPICMNAMPERVSCPCDYRIQNLVRVNVPKIEEQEPKIEEQKMNREDVIRMAREAGLSGIMEGGLIDYFERFAALVAAAERKACAKMFDGEVWAYDYREIAKAIRARGHEE